MFQWQPEEPRPGLRQQNVESQAREAINRTVAQENAQHQSNKTWQFGEFVERIYFPMGREAERGFALRHGREIDVNRRFELRIAALSDQRRGLELFTVQTASFRVLYCLFVSEHRHLRILHFYIARHRSAD